MRERKKKREKTEERKRDRKKGNRREREKKDGFRRSTKRPGKTQDEREEGGELKTRQRALERKNGRWRRRSTGAAGNRASYIALTCKSYSWLASLLATTLWIYRERKRTRVEPAKEKSWKKEEKESTL